MFVNADLIAAGLSPFASEAAAIKAGRIMLAEIDEHVATHRSFSFETTVSGRGYAAKVPRWRAAGYRVSIYFVSLPHPEMAVERVRVRMSQGGHSIPEAVIHRRFDSGLENFHSRYKLVISDWFLYDNQHRQPTLLAQGATP